MSRRLCADIWLDTEPELQRRHVAVQGGAKDTVSTSLDWGATWSSPIDTPVIEAMLGSGANWLAHSTTDANGTEAVKDGYTRYRIIIANQ